jgi:membrane protease YdiL (CAAX protease family)
MAHTRNIRSPRLSLALFLTPYIIPVLLLFFKVLPYDSRYIMLVILTAIMLVYCFFKKIRLKELGFGTTYLKGSLIWNGCCSAIAIIGMVVFYKLNLIRKPEAPDYNWFFIYYIFVSCPCQEFLYRSLIYAELTRRGLSDKYFIVISSLSYAFLHVFYHDWITVVVTLISGIVWGYIYKKYPCFWGVALSHAVSGVLSMLVGLI